MSRSTGPRQPFIAVVFLQPACNMDCTFCVTEDDFDAIESAQAVALLDRFEQQGVRSVTFGGGEPFAWKAGVLELAKAAKERGLQVQIGTNGLALPEDFATLPEVDRWVLPLESVDPQQMQCDLRWPEIVEASETVVFPNAKPGVTLEFSVCFDEWPVWYPKGMLFSYR